MTLSDIEIARQANKMPIKEVAKTLNLDEDSLHLFGNFTAKIPYIGGLYDVSKTTTLSVPLPIRLLPAPSGRQCRSRFP